VPARAEFFEQCNGAAALSQLDGQLPEAEPLPVAAAPNQEIDGWVLAPSGTWINVKVDVCWGPYLLIRDLAVGVLGSPILDDDGRQSD
jgi:hypothetical protein